MTDALPPIVYLVEAHVMTTQSGMAEPMSLLKVSSNGLTVCLCVTVRVVGGNSDELPESLGSSRRINRLLRLAHGGGRYLEIGVEKGTTFGGVSSPEKHGVDPLPLVNSASLSANETLWKVKSDTFFRRYKGPAFSVVFVDGLHESRQTYIDIINAFQVLEIGSGFVLVDDVWPTDAASSLETINKSKQAKAKERISHHRWYGDVFRAVIALARYHPEIGACVVGRPPVSHGQLVLWSKATRVLPRVRLRALIGMKTVSFEEVFAQDDLPYPWSDWISDSEFLGPGFESIVEKT